MSNCAALNCSSKYNDRSIKDLKFHRLVFIKYSTFKALIKNLIPFTSFPLNDPERLPLWLKICKPGFVPNKSSRLCDLHFPLSNFFTTPKQRFIKLNRNAVPATPSQSFVGKFGPVGTGHPQPTLPSIEEGNLLLMVL